MCHTEKTASGLDSFWAALGLAFIIRTAEVAWWAVSNFTIGLLVISRALYRGTTWAAPRVYRLARAGYREVRRRYALRPVVLDRQPVAAVTATTDLPTLADLRLKEPANR